MWLFLTMITIISTILNVILTIRNQDAKWFRFISLSSTALILYVQYNLVEKWVLKEDWSALADVIPSMSKILLVLTITSILINSISLFKK